MRSGRAHLKFEARAESSGAIGETIAVRNPTSSKRFQARIAAKGKVWVDAEGRPMKRFAFLLVATLCTFRER